MSSDFDFDCREDPREMEEVRHDASMEALIHEWEMVHIDGEILKWEKKNPVKLRWVTSMVKKMIGEEAE